MKVKKYALVGVGGRSRMFYLGIPKHFKETAKLVALCDTNQTRMNYCNSVLEKKFKIKPLPTYKPDQFETMIKREKPHTVIVCSIDRTHHKYINWAMELGCDVISEKPMTVDAEKCQSILDTIKKTKKKLRVTFNYRYSPFHTKIKEQLMNGAIGDTFSVHFEWLLDTWHGADYFRRWHRDKRNSGGLMVHKATHHFDLINYWLESKPKTVFAMGDLRFYGRENAESRGIQKFYSRAHGQENAKKDPFALDMEKYEVPKSIYLGAEHEDGYFRDQSVFGDGISIEDTMAVMVRYQNKAILSYSLNAYTPWEGYHIAFTGSKGRLEATNMERSYINSGGSANKEGVVSKQEIWLKPQFKPPKAINIPKGKGGHGGGDIVMLKDIFSKPKEDPYKRAASHVEGAWSILTGIAANRSFETKQPVDVPSLVTF